MTKTPAEAERYELFKGWGFVAVSGAALALLVWRYERRVREELGARAEAEERYRTLVEGAADAIIIVQGTCLGFANPVAAQLFEVPSREALVGRSMFDFVDPAERGAVEEGTARALGELSEPQFVRRQLRTSSGRVLTVDVGVSRIIWRGQPALQVALRDVSAAAAFEERSRRLERALRLAHEGAAVLLRSGGDDQVWPIFCRTLVEAEPLLSVWVGFEEGERGPLEPRASAGGSASYFDGLQALLRRGEDSPATRAMQDGRPCVVNDVAKGDAFASWRTLAGAHGLRAEVALPLLDGQRAFGVLCVAIAQRDVFDESVVQLLQHLGENAAFAFLSERTQKRVAAAEREALRLAEELSTLFAVIDTALVRYDGAAVARRANPRALAQLGFNPVGLSVQAVVDRLGLPPAIGTELARAIGGAGLEGLEVRVRGDAGRTFSRLVSVYPIRDGEGRPAGAVVAARDITALVRQADELRALAARLHSAREDEALRISRDLHDDLGQALTALKLELAALERQVELGNHRLLTESVVAAVELADQALMRTRRLAARLRPVSLDQLGLGRSLEVEVRDFSERGRVSCSTSIDLEVQPGVDVAVALYRIAQEALTNVLRHARATRVWVTLRREGNSVLLCVEDDGCGLSPEALTGLGLVGMRERALAVGGQFSLEPRSGGGLRVVVRVPQTGANQR
ncbi:MAG: GAF domain-containing protein [Myxococcota bacterium]